MKRDPLESLAEMARRVTPGWVIGAVVGALGFAGTVAGIASDWHPLAIVVVVLATLLFAATLRIVELSREASGTQSTFAVSTIGFVTPSGGEHPFYTAFLLALLRCAARSRSLNVAPFLPADSFHEVSLWSLFEALEAREVHVDGLFFIPDAPDQHIDELLDFHERASSVPLVLLDVYFDLSRCDERTRNRLPHFVGGDELLGGKLAAEGLQNAITRVQSPGPSIEVLVIQGADSAWERQRSDAFEERLCELFKDRLHIVRTPHIQYSRERAYEAVRDAVGSSFQAGDTVTLNGVFACNDDMALGARDAVGSLRDSGLQFEHVVQIVGYDGIREMQEAIRKGDPHLAATIDVGIEQQAVAALNLMRDCLKERITGPTVKLVPGQLIERPEHP